MRARDATNGGVWFPSACGSGARRGAAAVCHMLLDLVETAGKTLPAEQQLPRLCGVKMRYTDSAAAVGWRRVREDTSLVTVLHGVGECAGVEESLGRLCAEEAIEGYDTELHGRQTVLRRGRFHVCAALHPCSSASLLLRLASPPPRFSLASPPPRLSI